jgi:hypothetical protein
VDVAAARAYADAQPDRPIVFVIYPDAASATSWGATKQSMNITLGALSGGEASRSYFYVGSVERFVERKPTESGHALFDRISQGFLADMTAGLAAERNEPIVFSMKAFSPGAPSTEAGSGAGASAQLTEIAPNVEVVQAAGVAPFSDTAAAAAARARAVEARKLSDPSGPFDDLGHLLRNLGGLALILLVPGLVAARWFELDDGPSRLALVPGLSVALVLAAGTVVVAVHRGPFGPADGWATVALAIAASILLWALAPRVRRKVVEPDPPS